MASTYRRLLAAVEYATSKSALVIQSFFAAAQLQQVYCGEQRDGNALFSAREWLHLCPGAHPSGQYAPACSNRYLHCSGNAILPFRRNSPSSCSDTRRVPAQSRWLNEMGHKISILRLSRGRQDCGRTESCSTFLCLCNLSHERGVKMLLVELVLPVLVVAIVVVVVVVVYYYY